jgi:hypothetical protein
VDQYESLKRSLSSATATTSPVPAPPPTKRSNLLAEHLAMIDRAQKRNQDHADDEE